jgi:hypothetical protein
MYDRPAVNSSAIATSYLSFIPNSLHLHFGGALVRDTWKAMQAIVTQHKYLNGSPDGWSMQTLLGSFDRTLNGNDMPL